MLRTACFCDAVWNDAHATDMDDVDVQYILLAFSEVPPKHTLLPPLRLLLMLLLPWSLIVAIVFITAVAFRCDPRRKLLPVWDQPQQQLVLSSFDATTPSWQVMHYERMLRATDQQLLLYMSTSPDHEPHWFCQGVLGVCVCDVTPHTT